jgi:hypothetical protein
MTKQVSSPLALAATPNTKSTGCICWGERDATSRFDVRILP